MFYVYIISYAHVGMYSLFALMLPAWRSMHYILNCSSYLKYRLRVSGVRLVTNSICSRFFFKIIETQPTMIRLHRKYQIPNNWCTLIVAQPQIIFSVHHTVVIYGRLDTRVETRCPGGVSIYGLANRSRHFSYSGILFYFKVFVKFSLYHWCQEILTGLFIHQPTVSNYYLIISSVSLRKRLWIWTGHIWNYRLHFTLSHRRIRIVFLGMN